jgi:uncharacterized protein (DUF2336 family)
MTDEIAAKEEFNALMEMARDKSAAGRSNLVDAVGDLFGNNGNALSDRERALMTDILRQIIHDVKMSVRRALAEKISKMDNPPHDLALILANDDIEVAHPILIGSEILHDMDLVEVIRHRTMQHQMAIAMRRALSESVTDALVETGNQDVIKTMLENPNAAISKTTMEYLVEQSKRVDTYQNPLLRRPDIDPEIVKRMYWWVSAALRKHIVDHFDIDEIELDATLEDTVKNVMDKDSRNGMETGKTKPMELAEKLADQGELNSELLVKVLRQGEIPLFEALFARLSDLSPRLLRRILFEPGGEALTVVCKGVNIIKSDFSSIFMLTRKAHSSDQSINPKELNRVLELYDKIKQETAQAMLQRWQRDSNYLNAMRVLDKYTDPESSENERRSDNGSRRETDDGAS